MDYKIKTDYLVRDNYTQKSKGKCPYTLALLILLDKEEKEAEREQEEEERGCLNVEKETRDHSCKLQSTKFYGCTITTLI